MHDQNACEQDQYADEYDQNDYEGILMY